jgi:hypothetical protein
MHFIANLAATVAIAASLVSATNTVTFQNQDDCKKTIIFTPSENKPEIKSVDVNGGDEAKVEIPDSWQGNWYSIDEGQEDKPGMLGEVMFQGWNGLTYFDVSAIVDPNDVHGVKTIYPSSELKSKTKSTMSGCVNFPCNTAYYHPDDIQTVSTPETDLICTLGGGNKGADKREEPTLLPRKFVLGQF